MSRWIHDHDIDNRPSALFQHERAELAAIWNTIPALRTRAQEERSEYLMNRISSRPCREHGKTPCPNKVEATAPDGTPICLECLNAREGIFS